MTNKFYSKEINFLKTDSDLNITPPETYFSDFLLKKTIQIKTFEKRLSSAVIPENRFLCAVVKVSSMGSEPGEQEAKEIFEDIFNSIFDNKKGADKRGIWETIDSTSFVFAFWDYGNEERASELIISLKNQISVALETDILIGVAKFPYHQFSVSQTFKNALKAIDHAAFFGTDTLIHFDITSINICADRLYQLNRCELAVKEYQKGLEIDPANLNLINSLGVCFGVMGKLDKAKTEFEKALKINPSELMIIYNLGLLYQINEDIDRAVKYLQKAHGIDPEVFEVELLLGFLLTKQEYYEKALTHLETACRKNPDSGSAYRIKGEIFLKINQFEKAGKEFNHAIKLNPGDAVSLSGYAKSLELQNKNLRIALSFAKNSIELEPENKLFQKRLRIIQEKIETGSSFENKIKTA